MTLTLRSGATLSGRTALAPLTNLQSHTDGTLGEDELRFMARRAAGGFAWLSTCATFVSEEGHAWDGQLGIAHDGHLEGLTRLASAMKAHGGLAITQLHHGGAKASLAPVRLSTVDGENQRGATPADLERVKHDFVAAATRAQRAGFDGVEIHGANGYLFTQFLAPKDNPRQDEWGGSLEARARLLRETVRAVRAAVPHPFTVGVRISPVDVWAERGLVLADGLTLGDWLVQDGIDFLHLSLAQADGPPPHEPDAPRVATAFREALSAEVPILAAGGLWTAEDVDRAHAAGVDIAVLGRSAIGNPDWPKLAREPGYEPARPPWSAAQLEEASVGRDFVQYLRKFRTLVVEDT
ncbi:MAG: NADH:flavin oxidoreductase [Myxococcota bacterium]